MAQSQAVAKKDNGAVTENDTYDYGEFAGKGMEGAPQDAYAIPFLSVLQKTSPQVDEDNPAYIAGAKAGHILETVGQRIYDGKTGVIILPCAYQWTFLRWGPRAGDGGGFKGRVTGDDVAKMKAKGQIIEVDRQLFSAPENGGQFNVNRADRFQEAHYRYCLLVEEDESNAIPVLLSISSTQIRKSKALAARLDGVRVNTSNGKQKPPTWAHKVRMTTVQESNDKGSWYGMKFDLEGLLRPDDPLFMMGAEFNKKVNSGAVIAGEEHQQEAAASAAHDDDEDRPF